jgi:hypothetical protein
LTRWRLNWRRLLRAGGWRLLLRPNRRRVGYEQAGGDDRARHDCDGGSQHEHLPLVYD